MASMSMKNGSSNDPLQLTASVAVLPGSDQRSALAVSAQLTAISALLVLESTEVGS